VYDEMKKKVRRKREEMYVVLTADIVSSRKVARRRSLQSKVQRLLARLNERHSEIVAVPLTVSGGDEFQGVLKLDRRMLSIISDLQRELHPVDARVGIGIGKISTQFAQRSQEMDGEAFAFSREAVGEARKSGVLLRFRTPDPTFDLSANTIFTLTGTVKRRWKEIHWRRALLRDKGWTEQKVARREGVSQAAVSLCLGRAGYPAVREAEKNLAELIRRTWEHRPQRL